MKSIIYEQAEKVYKDKVKTDVIKAKMQEEKEKQLGEPPIWNLWTKV